jgi:hypothetical protein
MQIRTTIQNLINYIQVGISEQVPKVRVEHWLFPVIFLRPNNVRLKHYVILYVYILIEF